MIKYINSPGITSAIFAATFFMLSGTKLLAAEPSASSEDASKAPAYRTVKDCDLKGMQAELNEYFEKHPGHKLVIDVGHALEESDLLILAGDLIPKNAKNLLITNTKENVKTIWDDFLSHATGIESLELAGFPKLTRIGEYFLRGCTGLQFLKLDGLSNVIDIASFFLRNCTGLKFLNLGPLANVQKISQWFLGGCTGLKDIDFTPLRHLETIGVCLLEECVTEECKNLEELTKAIKDAQGLIPYICLLQTKKEAASSVSGGGGGGSA